MKAKTITVRSILPSSAKSVWEKLQDFKTLTYITKPLLSFKPRNEDDSGFKWLEGERYYFKLRLLSLIPIGVHQMYVERVDEKNYEIQTFEKNRIVSTWDHYIKLESQQDGTIIYTDRVEIHAGILTGLVCYLSKCFYNYRQKRWLKLLNSDM
ncbi:MAG: hypothetical protein ACOCRO_07440 [Halanaerobiales bacterium]